MIPLLLAMIQGTATSAPMPLTVTEIVDHLVQADNARMAVFSGYTGMRRYTFENKKLKKNADWIRGVHVVHRYDRIGKFWLPVAKNPGRKRECSGLTTSVSSTSITSQTASMTKRVRCPEQTSLM